MYIIPDPKRAENVADWVELYVAYNTEELSKSALSTYIAESSGADPSDDFVDDVWAELEMRESLYGNPPPFKIQGGVVIPNIDWHSCPEYMACLIFSLEGNSYEPLKSGTLFERIIREAINNYFGGQSLVTGFPALMPVSELANKLCEKHQGDPPWYSKDNKLDVISWKPFQDSRSSQAILLIQCAAGHDWTRKHPANVRKWSSYIVFSCQPIHGFAIPVLISDRERWHDTSMDLGLLIDRARIYRNIIVDGMSSELKGDLSSWCSARLVDMMS